MQQKYPVFSSSFQSAMNQVFKADICYPREAQISRFIHNMFLIGVEAQVGYTTSFFVNSGLGSVTNKYYTYN